MPADQVLVIRLRVVRREFRAVNQNGEDVTSELRAFAEVIGLERVAAGRYSIALLLGLFGGFKSGMQNPAKIIREIGALEGLGAPSRTKTAQAFTGFRLRGLIHKHYLSDGLKSLAVNMKNELDRSGIPLLKQKVADAEASGEERYFTVEDAKWIAYEASHGSMLRRMQRNALTGEWLIYAMHEGRSYYLCLGRHDGNDGELRTQIDAICCQEFPFLKELLSADGGGSEIL
jgi:hypothetical protein